MTDRVEEVLAALVRLADELAPALVPPGHAELLEAVTSGGRRIFQAAACSVALLDESETELVFTAASGAGAEEVVGMRVPVTTGIAGWVVASGEPIAVADVTRDARFARETAERTGYVPRSILATPLETDRRVLGVMEVLDRREDPRDMEVLGVLARQAALAIEQARAFSALGRALFTAAAEAVESADLHAALLAAAEDGDAARRDVVELAAHVYALGRLPSAQRRFVTRVVGAAAEYAGAGGHDW
jgi:GAF domain-containing protein